MSVVILIIILGVLIFVHEFGHFITAKKSGIRVDEFPIGGYVKIFGETPDEDSLDPNRKDSFLNKSAMTQASVLVGGVLFNVLLAFILFAIALMAGSPAIVTDDNSSSIEESFVVVTNVFEESPAEMAGLQFGDQILNIESINSETGEVVSLNSENITIGGLQETVSSSDGEISVTVNRNDEILELLLTPQTGIIGDKPAIGISMERIGKMELGFFASIGKAYLLTGEMIRDITIGLVSLIGSAIVGNASLDSVAGPVGIVGLVDNASAFGFYYMLTFTAFISINLAVLNILPFPALDGGRLLILLIETVSRRRIKHSVVNWINAIGFLILIGFMIVITINDISRLF
jgi:regulator of sigma E protease